MPPRKKVTPEQNQVAAIAGRNGWTLKRRSNYFIYSRAGDQVMLAFSKDTGDITSAYVNGIQVRGLSVVLEALARKES
jgi:hypothetical protein